MHGQYKCWCGFLSNEGARYLWENLPLALRSPRKHNAKVGSQAQAVTGRELPSSLLQEEKIQAPSWPSLEPRMVLLYITNIFSFSSQFLAVSILVWIEMWYEKDFHHHRRNFLSGEGRSDSTNRLVVAREDESDVPKNPARGIRSFLKKYLLQSSLHGARYVVEDELKLFERYFP